MKMRLHLAVAMLFLLLASSCSKEDSKDFTLPSAENVKAMEDELMGIVNSHRIDLGSSPLEFSAVAYQYANTHNDYMITQGGLSHDNFTARASSISSETNAENVAENIAKDYSTAEEAFESWLNSSKHRKTIEGDFTHSAISVKRDEQGNYYYTQLFYR